MSELLGQALKAARLDAGLTQAQLARKLGVSRVAVGQWEIGIHEPSTANLLNACEVLKVDIAAITGGRVKFDTAHLMTKGGLEKREFVRDLRQGRDENPFAADIGALSIARTIPVMETMALGSPTAPGEFQWAMNVIDYTRRPPAFETTRQLFAIYTPTSGMSPRFEIGELLFIWSARPASEGDDVIAELRGGDGKIKRCRLFRLTAIKAGTFIGTTFNPEERVELRELDVERLHRIVPWTELFD